MSSPNTNELYKKISANLEVIEKRIAEAAGRSGRSRDDVTIVAATKNVTVDAMRAALDCGIKVVGESRFQEAAPKIEVIGSAVEWHFIGHIQKNKVKFLTDVFSLVHSVDSLELAEAINRRVGTRGGRTADRKVNDRKVRILLQVNIGEEGSKHGVMPDEAAAAAEKIAAFLARCRKHPKQWDKISKGALARVDARYTWKHYAERLMTLSRRFKGASRTSSKDAKIYNNF